MTTNYRIDNLKGETLMVKTREQFKTWETKYNVTSLSGGKIDLRKARHGMTVRANGKCLRVYTTLTTPETFYKNR